MTEGSEVLDKSVSWISQTRRGAQGLPVDTRELDIKALYKSMWNGPQYRHKSPGMRKVMMLLHSAAREPDDTLIDLGCGMGECGNFLSKYFDVTLLDIVPEAVEYPELKFIEANMWELYGLKKFDWIFCSDVVEHIPPEYVEVTLNGMASITRKGGLISVCHLESDGADFGMDVGPLHLSVHPREWWQAKVEERWQLREYQTDWKETTFIVGEKL